MKNVFVLKFVRQLLDLTQGDIANMVGVDSSSIAQLERGLPALKRETVKEICGILSINDGFVYGEANDIFRPRSFLKMTVKGKHNMALPTRWFSLLVDSRKLGKVEVLLYCRKVPGKVIGALIRDSLGSVFIVKVEVFLDTRTMGLEALGEINVDLKLLETNNEWAGLRETGNEWAGLLETLGHSDADDRAKVESILDEKFKELLSEEEKELIGIVRKNPSNIKNIIRFATNHTIPIETSRK